MSKLAAEFARKVRIQLEHFGDPVVFTVSGGGASTSLVGIWIDPATRETTAPGTTMLMFFAQEDFAVPPARGDLVGCRGEVYEVITVAPDNSAGVTVGCKRT